MSAFKVAVDKDGCTFQNLAKISVHNQVHVLYDTETRRRRERRRGRRGGGSKEGRRRRGEEEEKNKYNKKRQTSCLWLLARVSCRFFLSVSFLLSFVFLILFLSCFHSFFIPFFLSFFVCFSTVNAPWGRSPRPCRQTRWFLRRGPACRGQRSGRTALQNGRQ